MVKCDNCIDFEKKLSIATQKLATWITDRTFFLVALNLSGQRELFEERAAELIDRYGLVRALRESRREKNND